MIQKIDMLGSKKTLKVLSLDFDSFYYLGEDYIDVQCYDYDWSVNYSLYKDVFSKVKNSFYYNEFKQIKSILKKNNNCSVYVSEDHSYV